MIILTKNNILSKKERNRLVHKINNTKLHNEDEVWDLAVELSRISVQLRAEILRRHEFDDYD